jgi:catechol 2,3-dioxygenase-like lactoylglutathione lyase family enzyme
MSVHSAPYTSTGQTAKNAPANSVVATSVDRLSEGATIINASLICTRKSRRNLPALAPRPTMSPMIIGLHHVQLAMPPGHEAQAIAFYAGVLGMTVVDKPPELQNRGGVWFELGPVRIHLGVETPFIAANKAHPALQVRSLAEMIATLTAQQIACRRDIDLPGIKRITIADPFGNRIELLQADPA